MNRTAIYFLLLVNLLIIFFFWGNNSGLLLRQGLPNVLISLGRLFGLLAVYFVLLQFLLIGRAVWIEKTFGLDKLFQLHHLNGLFSMVFIIFHPIFLIIGYAFATKKSVFDQFAIFLTSYEDVSRAFIAVIIFIVIVFSSIYIARKKLKYESWYFIHIFTYLAVLLAWGHQLKNGEDFLVNKAFVYYWYGLYTFVFGNVLVFRFFKILYLFIKHKFVVEKIVKETDDVVSVYISGKSINQFQVEPGQFMIFRFLTKDFWWQTHPFSLSQIPNGKNIRITVKNVGDFTSQLPSIKKGVSVMIDGPFGTFTKEQSKKEKLLLIVGGIGITPIHSLLQEMLENNKDVILLYCIKNQKDIVFEREIKELRKKYNFSVYFILTKEKKEGYLHGRLDGEKIQLLVKDFKEREVYICGPVPMMEALKKELVGLGVSNSYIHYEKFMP